MESLEEELTRLTATIEQQAHYIESLQENLNHKPVKYYRILLSKGESETFTIDYHNPEVFIKTLTIQKKDENDPFVELLTNTLEIPGNSNCVR